MQPDSSVLPGQALVPDSTIQHIISQRVDSQRSTGIVVGVLDPDGQRRVVPHGDPGPGQPPLGPRSVFEIGSIPKVFTATLLADMVQRAQVNLDDPVARFLPTTVTVPTRGHRQITLVDLATQTSGLPRLPTNLQATDPANPLADYTVQQLYAFLSEYVLPRDPGAQYEYSNLGFGLLGHALARRAGTSYQQLLAERILGPLGMTMTGVTLTPAMRRQLALPHNDRGEVVAAWDNPTLAGGGPAYSTATDLLTFAAANLDPAGGPLQRAMAVTHTPRHTITPGMRVGLGWHISRPVDRDLVWHNGQTGGSHGFIALDQARHTAVVVLSNSVSSIDDIGVHLLDERVELAAAAERPELSLAAEVLERYVGVYQLAPEGTVTVTQTERGLVAEATGLGIAPIYPASETEFFVKVINVQLTFQRDSTGAVTGLVLHHGGKDLPGKKLS